MLGSTLTRGQRAPCQGLVIAGRCRGTFDRCVISGCRSCGIRVRNDATPLLRENLIIGCAGPGMVVWNRGKPEMEETPAWKRLGKYHFFFKKKQWLFVRGKVDWSLYNSNFLFFRWSLINLICFKQKKIHRASNFEQQIFQLKGSRYTWNQNDHWKMAQNWKIFNQ